MDYRGELLLIQNYIVVEKEAFYLEPFGLDGTATKMTDANSGYMAILNGERYGKSIGAPKHNLHIAAGVLFINFYSDTVINAKDKSSEIVNAFNDLRLTSDTVSILFNPDGIAPSASQTPDAGKMLVTIKAPFHTYHRS